MEFIAKQSALLRELNLVQGVVERKTTIPVLANVLLSASGDTVDLMATDLEVSVRTSLSAAVTREGALTVSARKLHEIVRSLPDSEVHLKADQESWVTIACERSHFRIMGLPKDDFPTLPPVGKGAKVTFGVRPFREMVQKVVFAVTTDDARFALNGALMVFADGAVTLVASDGHRLAWIRRPIVGAPGKGAPEQRVIVPHKALSELIRMGEEIGGEIVFSRQENQMFFEMGRCTMTSRLLEGQFPNFEKVIPQGNDKIVEVDRAALAGALQRVALVVSDRNRAVKLALSSGALEVSARNPELGEARETLGVAYKGEGTEVGFNARYLIDFVGAVEAPAILLHLKDEATQALLTPKGGADDGEGGEDYKYVVMPMRI